MLINFEDRIKEYFSNAKIWTNVYGVGRSFIALSLLLTLVFNDAKVFFRPTSSTAEFPVCSNISLSIFCLVPNNDSYIILEILRYLSIVILLLVIIGWRPRYTGVLHWYIVFSWNTAATTLDGGEQVSAVITLLLIPLTLTDPRKWHWSKLSDDENESVSIYSKIIAVITYWFIRIQVAIIYLHSTIAKLFQEDWVNGTAVYYFLEDPIFGLNPHLHRLFDYLLTSSLIVVPTWGTLIIQTLLFCGLFIHKKYWKYILIAALLMHEVFAVILGLISFSLVMLGALILYLRPLDKEYSLINLKKNKPVEIKKKEEVV